MPFIIMCGLPSSGKTTRTNELKKYFEDNQSKRTIIVSDHRHDVDKNDVYLGSDIIYNINNDTRYMQQSRH